MLSAHLVYMYIFICTRYVVFNVLNFKQNRIGILLGTVSNLFNLDRVGICLLIEKHKLHERCL
jgi:hypothetical protein